MKTNPIFRNPAGFSLVEMLVVIAVIGIIAAIAVPAIGRINDAADDSKSKRNAQNLASVFASADAAGLSFLGVDKAATIANVVDGGTVSDTGSPYYGTAFSVPGLNSSEQSSAAAFLELSANGMLVYAPGGGTDDTPAYQVFSTVSGSNAGDAPVASNISAAQGAGWTGVSAVSIQELIPGSLYLFEVRGTPPA